MARAYLHFPKCSQMYLLQNGVDIGWQTGRGSGNDNCTEAVTTMFDLAWRLGPGARAAQTQQDIQDLMYTFVKMRNPTSDGIHGSLQNPGWIGDWLKQASNGAVTVSAVPSTFVAYRAAILRQHPVLLGFDAYMQILDFAGHDPYTWAEQPALKQGHVAVGVGFDDDYVDSAGKHYGLTAISHDPLRAVSGMPWDFSWASYLKAGLHLYEVIGPPLPFALLQGVTPNLTLPDALKNAGWQFDGMTVLSPNGIAVTGDIAQFVLTGGWDPNDYPLAAVEQRDSIEYGNPAIGPGLRQKFRLTCVGQASQNPAFEKPYRIWVGQEISALEQEVAALKEQSAAANTSPAGSLAGPSGWQALSGGGGLLAPNGIRVLAPFADYITGHPTWNPEDVPLGPAYATTSVEPGDPSIGAGQRQDFAFSSLGQTAQRGVYQIPVGRDLRALQTVLNQATEQLLQNFPLPAEAIAAPTTPPSSAAPAPAEQPIPAAAT